MSETLLSLSGVGRAFGALKAVDDVSLDVPSGARHALIGPNGAGKSTLFKLITGALPVSSGTISLAGSDITRLPEHQRARRGISQTLQHSSLFLTQTVQQNVLLAAQRRHGSRRSLVPRRQTAAVDRARALLADVGLEQRAGVPVAALGHGERRQVEVAVALACEPRLLLLDEPAAGVAQRETEALGRLLEELKRELELTLVIVEHDLDVVFALAGSVTVLHLGRVLLTGPPDEVRASEAVQEAYLGTGREALFLDGSGPAHLEVS